MKTPYFSAKYDGNVVHVRGDVRCRLGHKIARGAGEKPDGVFAEWQWDGNALTVQNDRLGFYPLYYCWRDGRISVSPSVTKLIREGAPRDLDYDALSVFMRYGNFVGEDTPFASIRAVPPDACFMWEKGRLDCAGAYPLSRERRYSRKELIDGFISLFRQSIRRRLPHTGNFVVPLSGGRDSRLILFELLRQGRTPDFCLTADHYPPRPNEDRRIASRLAAELDIKHEIIGQPGSRLIAELKKNLITDFCADEHSWLVPVAERLNGRVDTVYDGIGGDMLSDTTGDGICTAEISRFFEMNDLDAVADNIVRRSDRTIGRLVHPSHFCRMSFDRAKARLKEELKKHANAPNPVNSYYFWNRTRRKITLSPYRLLNGVRTVYSPYLDRDFTDFLFSVSWRSLQDIDLRTESILAAFPRYAKIPFEVRGAAWDYDTEDAWRHYAAFAGDILTYLRRNRPCSEALLNATRVLPALLGGQMIRSVASRYAWLYGIILYLSHLEVVRSRAVDGAYG